MPRPPFPLTMVGRLSWCVLLSFRVHAEAVEREIPRGLELVTREAYGRRWAFWNVVVCRVERMRPAGLPRMLGVSYHHAAYRLLVRARGRDGGEVRGLYFVRSDGDAPILGALGNLVSDFRFHRARVRMVREPDLTSIRVRPSDDRADVDLFLYPAREPPAVPQAGSAFDSMEEACAFLRYPPLAMCPEADGRGVRLAEVLRDDAAWHERVLATGNCRVQFLEPWRDAGLALELATWVEPIDYRWRLGRRAAILPRGT